MEIEKIKIGIAGLFLGAFATFGIGFGMGGWVLGDTAIANTEAAIVERLAPICFAQFKKDAARDRKGKVLGKLDYGKRGAYVENQGWATMPGEKKPDSAISEPCGDLITG